MPPARALVIEHGGDLLVAELGGERRHWGRIGHAVDRLARKTVQHDPDVLLGIAGDHHGTVLEGWEDAGHALSRQLVARGALVPEDLLAQHGSRSLAVARRSASRGRGGP